MSTIFAAQNQKVGEWTYLTTLTCYKCGVLFAMPKELNDEALRRTHEREFYCPNGHGQHYLGKSDREKLQEERERNERLRSDLTTVRKERDHHWIERKKTSTRLLHLKERVKHGVCPCCHRTFKQLARHMELKHPGFAAHYSNLDANQLLSVVGELEQHFARNAEAIS
jgi:hypothetical protein